MSSDFFKNWYGGTVWPYQVRWSTVSGTSNFRTNYGYSAPQNFQNRTLVRGTIKIAPDIVLNIPVPNTRTGFLPWYGVNSTGWQGTGTSGTRTAIPYRTVPSPYRTRHKSSRVWRPGLDMTTSCRKLCASLLPIMA